MWVAAAAVAVAVVTSASTLVATVVACIGVVGACIGAMAMAATVIGMTPAIGIAVEPSSMATTYIICRATGTTRAIFTISRWNPHSDLGEASGCYLKSLLGFVCLDKHLEDVLASGLKKVDRGSWRGSTQGRPTTSEQRFCFYRLILGGFSSFLCSVCSLGACTLPMPIRSARLWN